MPFWNKFGQCLKKNLPKITFHTSTYSDRKKTCCFYLVGKKYSTLIFGLANSISYILLQTRKKSCNKIF